MEEGENSYEKSLINSENGINEIDTKWNCRLLVPQHLLQQSTDVDDERRKSDDSTRKG